MATSNDIYRSYEAGERWWSILYTRCDARPRFEKCQLKTTIIVPPATCVKTLYEPLSHRSDSFNHEQGICYFATLRNHDMCARTSDSGAYVAEGPVPGLSARAIGQFYLVPRPLYFIIITTLLWNQRLRRLMRLRAVLAVARYPDFAGPPLFPLLIIAVSVQWQIHGCDARDYSQAPASSPGYFHRTLHHSLIDLISMYSKTFALRYYQLKSPSRHFHRSANQSSP